MSFAVPSFTTGALTGSGLRIPSFVSGAFTDTGLFIPSFVTGEIANAGLRIPLFVTGALVETRDLLIPLFLVGDFRNERARDSSAVMGSTAVAAWNPVGLVVPGAAVVSGPIVATWNTRAVAISSSTITSTGTPGQAIFIGVTSSAAITGSGASPTIFFEVVASSSVLSGPVSAQRVTSAIVTGTAVLNGVVLGQASYRVSAASTAEIISGIQFLQDYWDGWAFNLNTNAASFYENFKFNSFARIGKNYYGCNETGIHLLGGDLDGTARIDSTITTGTSDLTEEGVGGFKGDIQKRVPYAYISARSAETMTLTCLVEGQEFTYTFRAPTEKVAVSRVDIGKGLLGTFWQFELKNQNGADFEMDSISVLAVPTTRKI